MRRGTFLLSQLCFGALMALVFLPGRLATKPPYLFAGALTLIEASLLFYRRRHPQRPASGDIALVVYLALMAWEVLVTQLGLGHRILTPAPENVFYVFYEQAPLMLRGVGSSLSLLGVGFAIALGLGIPLGLLVGFVPRLRDMLLPIARVLSPIPPIIYTPYVVALMPTFRSASALILVLGIFWPTFMNMILRVGSVDAGVMNAARAMNLPAHRMIFQVLLPYSLPGILSGLKVSLSTSFLVLTIAEMMGATSGLGYFVKTYSDYANYTNVVAGILLVALVVSALNALLARLEALLVRWR